MKVIVNAPEDMTELKNIINRFILEQLLKKMEGLSWADKVNLIRTSIKGAAKI